MDTLSGLPLREIGDDLRDTVKGVKEIATSETLGRSIAELESTLRQVSKTARDLNRKLKEIAAAARSIYRMADYLERHPDAFLKARS